MQMFAVQKRKCLHDAYFETPISKPVQWHAAFPNNELGVFLR